MTPQTAIQHGKIPIDFQPTVLMPVDIHSSSENIQSEIVKNHMLNYRAAITTFIVQMMAPMCLMQVALQEQLWTIEMTVLLE